ncbi:MAG: protein translocase subunit SecD [Gammaproteobacteria bacterium]|nr:MAG: protein translocase subunit SecD [Gammaproteobacteria bacterium]
MILNRYPWWKNLLIVVVVALAAIYAAPNLYGEDPAVQISPERGEVPADLADRVEKALTEAGLTPKAVETQENGLLVRFADTETQLAAAEAVRAELGDGYTVALNLAPATPDWLRALNAKPMYLGLDLRGGVHFLLQVDMESVIDKKLEGLRDELRRRLREEKLRYHSIAVAGRELVLRFDESAVRDQAYELLRREFAELEVDTDEDQDKALIRARLRPAVLEEERRNALVQNIVTLRNRVNQLGVAEPIIQRQGEDRIVVQLPGVQDTAKAKEILQATATLEYRLVHGSPSDWYAAESTGRVPPEARLYHRRDGSPILLKRSVIVSGENIVNATAGYDQRSNMPAVFVTLDNEGAARMAKVSGENIGQPMAVVFIETKLDTREVDGRVETVRRTTEEVISVATIRDQLGKRFQTTGLELEEARELALLLRAGALSAPMAIVEERTVGPSLGRDNIAQGFRAVLVGLALVALFMAVYYRVFGLIADVALFANLVLIVAVLSLLQATLTMPGIAGIVLTVGMAVDANVLIFERIREELANGNSVQASIHAGYEKAFSTIADANITTLIAAVILFALGSGPVKGFAVTLTIGILTSMFTGIMGTRALVNAFFGARRLKTLPI